MSLQKSFFRSALNRLAKEIITSSPPGFMTTRFDFSGFTNFRIFFDISCGVFSCIRTAGNHPCWGPCRNQIAVRKKSEYTRIATHVGTNSRSGKMWGYVQYYSQKLNLCLYVCVSVCVSLSSSMSNIGYFRFGCCTVKVFP